MSPPFTIRILKHAPYYEDQDNLDAIRLSQRPTNTTNLSNDSAYAVNQDDAFSHLLPASIRTGKYKDTLIIPQSDIAEFLRRDLSVDKIDNVKQWLWVCGRPMPPRPLHHQVSIQRNITITEDPELHLVWSNDRIFIKPLPQYLLEPDFWANHITGDDTLRDPQRQYLASTALGFLHSYCALVAYESDFRIAQANGLLPSGIPWAGWRRLAQQVLNQHKFEAVNPRYWYGELRLSRLNKIYKLGKGQIFRGFSRIAAHAVYTDLLADNFTVLAAILGYLVIVLSAMQVGLGTEKLSGSTLFQDVSYGFTVFSLIAPLASVLAIVAVVIAMFISNWLATKSYERHRLRAMQLPKAALKASTRSDNSEIAYSAVKNFADSDV